ncbi:MAG: response regulator transcription factor [Clostridia bacterium]|nr:response regulator transcription factor [Clostridia bacterium]MCI9275823.1 response regulator transcription factor [Clostridia bacterium]
MQILLVEDNLSIAKGLMYSLEQKEYKVLHAENVKCTIEIMDKEKIDLVILDVSLPDGNGFDLYKSDIIKKKIPTIFLTARDDENDIVKGLELGAEDYITKPFSTKELIARINKVLSRGKNQIIHVKDIEFDMDKMQVYKAKKAVELSNIELKILHLLFLNLNKVVTRDEIIEKIWDWTGNDVNNNTVTVYMKRIREKLEEDIIVTIKGIGYRIDGE